MPVYCLFVCLSESSWRSCALLKLPHSPTTYFPHFPPLPSEWKWCTVCMYGTFIHGTGSIRDRPLLHWVQSGYILYVRYSSSKEVFILFFPGHPFLDPSSSSLGRWAWAREAEAEAEAPSLSSSPALHHWLTQPAECWRESPTGREHEGCCNAQPKEKEAQLGPG